MEIFVGNLSFDATQEDIASTFGEFGAVSNIKMLTDRETGRFRGIAFVSMEDVSQGQAAIDALNGKEFLGRNLKVEASQPREQRSGGERRSFGGNRGGFGGNRGGGNRGFGGNRGNGGSRGGFGGGSRY